MTFMNVAFVNPKINFNNFLGMGTQRYIFELWKNMSLQSKKVGVKLRKISPGFSAPDLYSKISFTLLLPFEKLWEYDVVHAPTPIVYMPPRGNAITLTTMTEFVKVAPDSPYALAMKAASSRTQKSISNYFSNMIYRSVKAQALSSDYLITISTLVKGEAIKEGFDKNKVFVVNIGIDERFNSTKKLHKNKKFTLGYLGGLNVRKNVSFAINAFSKIKDRGIQFKIYGKGPETLRLKEQASGDSRIRFMGFAPEEQIVDIYDSFDAMVYPILYTGFEMEIIEAQARGIPVITYKEATIPTEVKKYCIEASDESEAAAIVEDIKENGYNIVRRKKAMEYARGFTWERCARETLAVYTKIS